jgi:hypothetical protein
MPFVRLAKGNPNLISVKKAAELLGMRDAQLRYRIESGEIEAPKTKVGLRFYYSPNQIKEIKTNMKGSTK